MGWEGLEEDAGHQLCVQSKTPWNAFALKTLSCTSALAGVLTEPTFDGQVFRDGARLNLRHLDEPAIRPELQDKEHLLSASITVDDAKPLFLEFQAASVAFHQTLKTEPWGARTFVVRDPDGHLILFAGQGQEPQELA